jgi:hypothetical protein
MFDRGRRRPIATVAQSFGNERGVALPTAMIALIILMALTFAFSSLATTEPRVARNHVMGAQARALAESGLERALWAINNSSSGGISDSFTGGTAPHPYNGDTLLNVSAATGGFLVTMTDGTNPASEKLVTTVGWAPDNTGMLRAARKIQATLVKPPLSVITPPAALSVKGNLDVTGNATITSYSGTTGVAFCASAPTGGTMTTGTTTQNGSSQIYGPGNSTANEAADMLQGSTQPVPSLTTDDIAALKAVAKSRGTYYQGTVSFDSGNPLPTGGGVVFVDTTTGNDLTMGPPATPSTEQAYVTISGNQTWSGWIIAIGDVTVSGTVNLTGAVYARNDFVFTGNGTITGAVIAENKLVTVQSSVDSSESGSSQIIYNCPAFQSGGGTVSTKWTMKAGTFRETAGQ